MAAATGNQDMLTFQEHMMLLNRCSRVHILITKLVLGVELLTNVAGRCNVRFLT